MAVLQTNLTRTAVENKKKKVTYASYLLGHFLCIYREAALFLVHELQMLHIDSLLDLLSSLH